MAENAKKRKPPSDAAPAAKRPRFAQRPQHHIAAQPTKSAYPNGEVNVKNFLKSHEDEIKALERAMTAARKGLARRAFQDVPREMRRRTASHNPQRVPKRLQVRAKREAKEDNTPISRGKGGSGVGKGAKAHLRKEGREKARAKVQHGAKRRKASDQENGGPERMDVDEAAQAAESSAKTSAAPRAGAKKRPQFPALATPATPPSRFRRRQKDKTWLPTHIWHSKRAHMTEPKHPLWRFAMPLQPVVKAYRLTHRAATQRGAVAWDTSYMSTISLEGVEASLVGMLKGLHFASEAAEDPWSDRGRAKKWRHGTRAWEGWIYTREAKPKRPLAPVTVLWCPPAPGGKKRKAFLRVHPSAFLQLWNEVIRISKVQKPGVAVEDLRFEIGSIEIMGPAAAETVSTILSPTSTVAIPAQPSRHEWSMLAAVTDVGVLPLNPILAFDISDPRLRDPCATSQVQYDDQSQAALQEMLATWPLDASPIPCSLFNRDSRLAAQRAMPSDKTINRRRSACTPGELPEARPTDPQIPMLLHVSRHSKSWLVLLPWKCVQAVWRGITRYPVSTGGNPRFGGLKERRQVAFERSSPLFPFDHPGTDAGWAWEMRERDRRKHEWTKRPRGKRIEWATIDLGHGRKGEIGNPWACDWERLLSKIEGSAQQAKETSDKALSPISQLSASQAAALTDGRSPVLDYLAVPYVFTVKIIMTQRGVPGDCARIYRLPTNNAKLRSQWLSLVPKLGPGREAQRKYNDYTSDTPEHVKRKELARNLLEGPMVSHGPPKAGEDDYPIVPDEEDLIGFVTSGNYNLAAGMPSAVANIALHRVAGSGSEARVVQREDRVCIVRQAGSTMGRLATWEVV